MTDLTIDNIIEALTKAKEKIAEEREHRHNAIESAIHELRVAHELRMAVERDLAEERERLIITPWTPLGDVQLALELNARLVAELRQKIEALVKALEGVQCKLDCPEDCLRIICAALIPYRPPCSKCGGAGFIQKTPIFYETDSPEEHSQAWKMARYACECRRPKPTGAERT